MPQTMQVTELAVQRELHLQKNCLTLFKVPSACEALTSLVHGFLNADVSELASSRLAQVKSNVRFSRRQYMGPSAG